ncbi:hypothetical protein WB401_44490 [Streptomyces brasiliscabiei]|uniref:Secreted protein n=1 Tax=Streptomyces brasiliscabiei TaxID=2736302 RepID=A0ABU8GVY7_9ACTN
MDAFLPFLIAVVGFAVALCPFVWLGARIRRRGAGGGAVSGALAAYDEAFRATAHASYVEIRAQAERRAPLLSPDDHRARSPGRAATRTGTSSTTPSASRPRPGRARRGLRRWTGRLRPSHRQSASASVSVSVSASASASASAAVDGNSYTV